MKMQQLAEGLLILQHHVHTHSDFTWGADSEGVYVFQTCLSSISGPDCDRLKHLGWEFIGHAWRAKAC